MYSYNACALLSSCTSCPLTRSQSGERSEPKFGCILVDHNDRKCILLQRLCSCTSCPLTGNKDLASEAKPTFFPLLVDQNNKKVCLLPELMGGGHAYPSQEPWVGGTLTLVKSHGWGHVPPCPSLDPPLLGRVKRVLGPLLFFPGTSLQFTLSGSQLRKKQNRETPIRDEIIFGICEAFIFCCTASLCAEIWKRGPLTPTAKICPPRRVPLGWRSLTFDFAGWVTDYCVSVWPCKMFQINSSEREANQSRLRETRLVLKMYCRVIHQ